MLVLEQDTKEMLHEEIGSAVTTISSVKDWKAIFLSGRRPDSSELRARTPSNFI